MTSLDTNVVLRFLLNDIPAQTAKAKTVITGGAVYITDVVAIEVIFVLERVIGLRRRDIVALIEGFLNLPNLIYNDYFLEGVIEMFGARPSLSVVDCYAATEAKVYGNALVTFDQQLAKHGGRHVRGL